MNELKMPAPVADDAAFTVQVINPVITATVKVFKTMLAARARRRELAPLLPDTVFFPLNAAIDLTGPCHGRICLSFPNRTAIVAVSRLLDVQASQVSDMHLDAICELANVITGVAKADLQEFQMRLHPPTIIEHHELRDFPPGSSPLLLRFSTDIGPLMISFGFSRTAAVATL